MAMKWSTRWAAAWPGSAGGLANENARRCPSASTMLRYWPAAKAMRSPPGSASTHYDSTGFFTRVCDEEKGVLDGIEKMASEVPGLKNLWLKSVKVQGSRMEKQPDGSMKTRPFTDAFVMEFENEAAFKAYEENPAHRAWSDKVYLPVRGYSSTHDITNQ